MTDNSLEEFIFENPIEAVGYAQLRHVVTLDHELSDGAYRTFATYIKYAQQKPACWPSIETIATDRGKSTATVSRHNQELEALGYIKRQRRTGLTTLTVIRDLNQVPRLQELAAQELQDRNRNNATCKVAIMQDVKLQKRHVKEEQIKEEPQKKKESSPEKPNVLDAIFHYATREPSDNWADTAAAGGADDWAPAVDAFAGLVGLDPSTVPKGTRREWSRQIQEVGRDWQAGPSLLTEIISKVPESELHWKTYTSPHGAKADLGVLIGQHRSGGIRKAKKTNGGTQASAIAGIAAYKEKMRREVVEAEFVVMGEAL